MVLVSLWCSTFYSNYYWKHFKKITQMLFDLSTNFWFRKETFPVYFSSTVKIILTYALCWHVAHAMKIKTSINQQRGMIKNFDLCYLKETRSWMAIHTHTHTHAHICVLAKFKAAWLLALSWIAFSTSRISCSKFVSIAFELTIGVFEYFFGFCWNVSLLFKYRCEL